jgi:hypothetical protein
MGLDLALSALAIILSVGGGIYKILAKIDSQSDSLTERIAQTSLAHSVEREKVNAKLELHEYLIHANTELISHKAKRLEQAIAEINGYLAKSSSYVPRAGYKQEVEP